MVSESAPLTQVRTFLIANVRGFTRFTEERGDEEAWVAAWNEGRAWTLEQVVPHALEDSTASEVIGRDQWMRHPGGSGT